MNIFLSLGSLEINLLNPYCMPGAELQMETQPRACSQRSQGRQGRGAGGGGSLRRGRGVLKEGTGVCVGSLRQGWGLLKERTGVWQKKRRAWRRGFREW